MFLVYMFFTESELMLFALIRSYKKRFAGGLLLKHKISKSTRAQLDELTQRLAVCVNQERIGFCPTSPTFKIHSDSCLVSPLGLSPTNNKQQETFSLIAMAADVEAANVVAENPKFRRMYQAWLEMLKTVCAIQDLGKHHVRF